MTIFGSIILNRLRIEPVLPFSHSILHARNPSFISSLPPSTIYSTDFALLAFIQHSTPPQSNSKTKRKEIAGEGDRTLSSPLQPGCNLALQTSQLTWLPKFFLSFNFSLVFMRPIFPLAVWDPSWSQVIPKPCCATVLYRIQGNACPKPPNQKNT